MQRRLDMKKRMDMPRQKPEVRGRNFNEVALGYTEDMALEEASRCLGCKKPSCVKGCPVEIDIPAFIDLIKEGKYRDAINKIKEKNSLPAICGRVCPQEDQCEIDCILAKKYEPVAIGRLERFVADLERAAGELKVKKPRKTMGMKVGIIGSGPAGLTAAADLARMGYNVTIFEALHKAGGVLTYGIPEFRLPKDIVAAEVDYIKKLGVDIKVNYVIGATIASKEIVEGFDAVFIATGAGLPWFMGIPGENLIGVYSANEFLTRSNLMKAYLFPEWDTPIKVGRKVAVVGGGNVAMDSARTALRLGADEVYLLYRRGEEELPARKEEAENAKEEGIIFKLLTNPVEVIGKDGHVAAVKCIRMELGEPDESGRRKPIPVPNSEFVIEIDVIVMAIGQGPNPMLTTSTPGLELNRKGYIVVNEETQETSIKGVFAGGDIVTGAATVISAMGAGKRAARSINAYLQGKSE